MGRAQSVEPVGDVVLNERPVRFAVTGFVVFGVVVSPGVPVGRG